MQSSNSSPRKIIGEQTQNLIERSAKTWKVDTLYYNLPIFLWYHVSRITVLSKYIQLIHLDESGRCVASGHTHYLR